jgi:hypothetical protein
MARRARFLTIALTAVALVCGLVGAGLTGAATGAPALRLVARQPLTVAGRGFEPLERVRLVAAWESGKAIRRIQATRSGSFALRFSGNRLGRCEALIVRAVGAQGSRALLEPPQPACLPA